MSEGVWERSMTGAMEQSKGRRAMEHRIIFATSNQGKMREIREILKGLGTEILSMKEAGVQADIVEDGDTFEANAVIKAKAVWEEAGGIVLADDSGLEVDALGGEPGVYSARYMGEKTSYEIKNWNLIHRLAEVPEEKRTARFVCVIAAVLPDGRVLTTRGTMEGRIAYEPAGAGGFGYDPILMLPEYGKTSAEITMEEKNAISHRGKALRAMKELLEKRRASQPLEFPSAGSTFKRPEGYYAGTLIDQCGLKGLTVGGAQVSEKHAGFVINRGGATCADVKELIRQIQERVFAQAGVRLEPEVRIID